MYMYIYNCTHTYMYKHMQSSVLSYCIWGYVLCNHAI